MPEQTKHSEAEMLAALIPWVEAQGMEVYREVVGPCGRADLVGLRVTDRGTRLLHVFEGKLTLSLDLLAQACAWRSHAHLVTVVTPKPKRAGNGAWFAHGLLRERGIGHVEMAPTDALTRRYDPGHPPFLVSRGGSELTPRLNRRPASLPDLHERQRTLGTPGSNRDRYWTPFGETVDRLGYELARRCAVGEGVRLDALVRAVPHHYAHDRSAVGSLATMIARGVIVGCELRSGLLVRTAERVGLHRDA